MVILSLAGPTVAQVMFFLAGHSSYSSLGINDIYSESFREPES